MCFMDDGGGDEPEPDPEPDPVIVEPEPDTRCTVACEKIMACFEISDTSCVQTCEASPDEQVQCLLDAGSCDAINICFGT